MTNGAVPSFVEGLTLVMSIFGWLAGFGPIRNNVIMVETIFNNQETRTTMTIVGGKFTTRKSNLVTYVEDKQYELLRELAALNDRSV